MVSQASFKLSATSYAVLGLLRLLGEATPYDLKRAIGYSIENFWPVPHTTFYAEPERLAAAGYLRERRETEGRRRRLYSLTDQGREALRQWVASADAPPPQLRDEGTLKVFFGADPAAVYRPRIAWHREKLHELEGYRTAVEATLAREDHELDVERGALEGVLASLVAGTTYHRVQLEALEATFGTP